MDKNQDNEKWFKKNKDWLVTVGVFLGFVVVLSLSGIFLRGSGTNDEPVVEEEASFTPPQQQNESAQSSNSENKSQSNTFYLRPGPDELLQKLEGLNHQEFKKETQSLPGLRVMWPAYFFQVIKVANNIAEIMLDASEDGFGVLLVTEIDVKKYPEIMSIERGKKIWLAAEIIGVDPAGTGQVLLSTQYVRFDDYTPKPASAKAKESK